MAVELIMEEALRCGQLTVTLLIFIMPGTRLFCFLDILSPWVPFLKLFIPLLLKLLFQWTPLLPRGVAGRRLSDPRCKLVSPRWLRGGVNVLPGGRVSRVTILVKLVIIVSLITVFILFIVTQRVREIMTHFGFGRFVQVVRILFPTGFVSFSTRPRLLFIRSPRPSPWVPFILFILKLTPVKRLTPQVLVK